MLVEKRDGRVVKFHRDRIIHAILKAMKEVENIDIDFAQKIADQVEAIDKDLSVEEIQDLIEKKLMASSYKDVAKAYILYREKRTTKRENNSKLMKLYDGIINQSNKDILNENANVDGESPMGQMGKIGYESARIYALEKLVKPHIRNAIKDNYIYPHDFDFYSSGTTTCCQIPLGKMLEQGFNTGHGYIRQPSNIISASALSAIILQANQNMQHGGQAYPTFDYDLAPYVTKTYRRYLKEFAETEVFKFLDQEQVEKMAWEKTEKDCYQAMEAFVHNMNSMNSRSAGQVPFTSVNYGTDTSREGRLIVKSILLATEAGLGSGETPIFPIQIFKVKEGVNFNPSDPNYDLFELSLRVTSKRLFPNYGFLDAPYNLQYYREGRPETECAYMGCRTRVIGNVNGDNQVFGRGNLSFTTLNLVKMALENRGDIRGFMQTVDKFVDLGIEQMLDRYHYQCSKKAKNFKFLYQQHVWMASEKLKANDNLGEVLKHGTLSLGFIGLAEALKALLGEHHGESDQAQQIGVEVIKFIRNKLDEASRTYGLNFTLLATPAEGLSGKFVKKDKKDFGAIEGVTDREYYTNSFHVPVYYKIKAVDKVRKEAPFHELCNAGHITYIEFDGNARNNVEAFKQVVIAMKESGIGYGSINHPVDRCEECGYQGIIGDECPQCHAKESEGAYIYRIRRITGYLVGSLDRWNSAKRAEEKDRIKHS